MLVLSMSVLFISGFGQTYQSLTGIVVNEDNVPLEGATVILKGLNKGAVTDANGQFAFRRIPSESCIVQIEYLGYQTLIDTVSTAASSPFRFQLVMARTNLNEVELSTTISNQRPKETPLNIETVDNAYIKQNLSGSLMKSLEKIPGVTTMDIGSGQSKPVIRGLGFNRVVVVENNVKHQAQQWGADHGLEIDQYAANDVEVIKGPASLMYGSDAIGGVIDVKSTVIPEPNTIGGVIDLTGKTNNDLIGTSAYFFARKQKYFGTFRATLLDYGDYKVPTDSIDIYSYRAGLHKNYLRNTAGHEINFNTSFGLVEKKFQSVFFVSNVYSKSGFFANTHGLEPREVDTELHDRSNRDIQFPYQNVNHFKVTNSSSYKWSRTNLEVDLGYQNNFRQEWSQYVQHGYMPAVFPDTLPFNKNLERQFKKDVFTANAKVFYIANEKTQLNFGFNGEYQNNTIDGRGFIIPAFTQVNLGGFAFANHKLSSKSSLQAGIRYDYGQINTKEYYDWFPSPVIDNEDTSLVYLQRAGVINRSFSNASWSVGYNYNPDNWLIKANIGKSFRMPLAQELAANGVNYHRFSYEVGNPNLSPEVSYQFDAGATYQGHNFYVGATPFINYFTNYIYLNPTAQYDWLYGNGNQVFEYTESEVFRYGAELTASYNISNAWQAGVVGEYVYSLQMSGAKEGYTLPFSPPATAVFNVRYQKDRFDKPWLSSFENTYVSLDYRLGAAQNNIVPPEIATEGYQVVHLSFGGQINISNQPITINMQIQNLFNAKYFNHMSYYRLINVPEPGRNFVVNISIPFTSKFN